MNIFVTGTDTGVGKTVISGALCLKMERDYWKPIQSGPPSDSEWISGRIKPLKANPEVYRLTRSLSPHQSARHDGVNIELSRIAKSVPSKSLIIEGAGGLLVPLNETDLMIDLIAKLKVKTILVARSGLGTINHTLLSLQAARLHCLEVIGVVLVGNKNLENKNSIEFYGNTTVIGEIPMFDDLDRQALEEISQLISLEGSCA